MCFEKLDEGEVRAHCVRQAELLARCRNVLEAMETLGCMRTSRVLGHLMEDLRDHVEEDAPPPADVRLLASANDLMLKRLRIQDRIGAWQREAFGDKQTVDGMLLKLREEFVELIQAESDQEMAQEAADMAHLLFGLCALLGFDLLEEVEAKFAINQARKWGAPDAKGCISHVREP